MFCEIICQINSDWAYKKITTTTKHNGWDSGQIPFLALVFWGFLHVEKKKEQKKEKRKKSSLG